MNWWFIATCFLIGVSSSSTVGPIFVMTFNYSATRNFLRGFFVGLGAAVGDFLLMLLGMMGMLKLFEKSPVYRVVIDLAGGVLLLAVGLLMIFRPQYTHTQNSDTGASRHLLNFVKAFLSIVLNPLALLFFMFASAQVMPMSTNKTVFEFVAGSFASGLGSLVVLSCVAWVGSNVGRVIRTQHLYYISLITGAVIISVGSYFMYDGALIALQWLIEK